MLDRAAVEIFASKGVALGEVAKRDFAWSHDPYLKHENVKDLEIRIHTHDYMGEVVHKETHSRVPFEQAYALAESVLTEYVGKVMSGPRHPSE